VLEDLPNHRRRPFDYNRQERRITLAMATKKAPVPPIREYPGYILPIDPAATFPATLRLFNIDT